MFAGPRGGRISTAVPRDAPHWEEAVTKLGYEHLRRHDLRHTGLTWFTDAGVPVHVLRKIAGHGSLTTAHPGFDSESHDRRNDIGCTMVSDWRTAAGPSPGRS
ncbi:tyrosine-type recombinase/integrase [Streptomyces vietnamensis]|uniref:tyrosine-type recombinase/integrase n=1 Tax=Streptomyces vietnamensis TaxID=362257 RepID=UPI000B227519|nr:tyrosine-type recombinase/integrase [Streptomyces vietnamensis]